MASITYDLDEGGNRLTIYVDYFIAGYGDPETMEWFSATAWTLQVTDKTTQQSGGTFGYGDESGSGMFDIGFDESAAFVDYAITFAAYNTFSGHTDIATLDLYVVLEGLDIVGTGVAETLEGGGRADTIDGGAGTDLIQGFGGADLLLGGGGGDHLWGGDGNDTLGGIAGHDTLEGGAGDDLYRIDTRRDVIVEAADGGHDTIAVTAGGYWKLGDHVESLIYAGNAKLQATGTASANSLTGGWNGDILNGWAGNDTLAGRAGWDKLDGGKGDDVLSGGSGEDTLTGGVGADTFVLGEGVDPAKLALGRTVTTITDFHAADDTIRLDAAVFQGLAAGAVASEALMIVSDPNALIAPGAATRLIYDATSGRLAYDADGAGAAPTVIIAHLKPGLTLGADDFFVG